MMILITTCFLVAGELCLVEINQEEDSSSQDDLGSQNNPLVLLLRCSWYNILSMSAVIQKSAANDYQQQHSDYSSTSLLLHDSAYD